MNEQLMQLRNEMDAKRVVMDEKRIALDALRSGYQQSSATSLKLKKKWWLLILPFKICSRAIQQIDEEKVQREASANNWMRIGI